MPDDATSSFFELFTEIGIVEQLSRALLEARLPDGMLVSHFAVLSHLIRVADGRTPLDLARAFQVPKTTMTHTLAGLAKAGLVETRDNPRDGRSKIISITPAGRAFRDTAITSLAPDIAALRERFSDAEVAAILPGLRRLRAIMDEMRD